MNLSLKLNLFLKMHPVFRITDVDAEQEVLLHYLCTTSGLTVHQWQWLHYLITHPEKHRRWTLGHNNQDDVTHCCLGQMTIMFYQNNYVWRPTASGKIMCRRDQDASNFPFLQDAIRFGLRSEKGTFVHKIQIGRVEYTSLASINDGDQFQPWLYVAAACLLFPQLIFTTYTDEHENKTNP